MVKEKAYHVSAHYYLNYLENLFKNVPEIPVFTRELWLNNKEKLEIRADVFGSLGTELARNHFLALHSIENKRAYSLTKFGKFIADNIHAQYNLVADIIHINHLILYRINPCVEHTFSAFYNIASDYIYKRPPGKDVISIELNKEIISKMKDKDVGMAVRNAQSILQWFSMLDPPIINPGKYIRQPTDYCSIERVYFALTSLYVQYGMHLGTPLLIDDKVLEDIKLYLLVPESEILPHLRLLSDNYSEAVQEQTSQWGTSFILSKWPDVPFPWLPGEES